MRNNWVSWLFLVGLSMAGIGLSMISVPYMLMAVGCILMVVAFLAGGARG